MAGKHPEEKVGQIEKVVMYSRIGYSVGAHEDEARFVGQEQAMLEFCTKHNLEVKDRFREIAPGTLDLWSRPMLDNALASIKWSNKEKSVVLVSRADRLSKEIGVVARLQDNYNPKFLVCSTGLRIEQFVTQIQVACAEEEFRLKYGDIYHTSDMGLKEFARCARLLIELRLKDGKTLEQIAEAEDKMDAGKPWRWEWTAESVQQLIDLWD